MGTTISTSKVVLSSDQHGALYTQVQYRLVPTTYMNKGIKMCEEYFQNPYFSGTGNVYRDQDRSQDKSYDQFKDGGSHYCY